MRKRARVNIDYNRDVDEQLAEVLENHDVEVFYTGKSWTVHVDGHNYEVFGGEWKHGGGAYLGEGDIDAFVDWNDEEIDDLFSLPRGIKWYNRIVSEGGVGGGRRF